MDKTLIFQDLFFLIVNKMLSMALFLRSFIIVLDGA